MPARLGGAVPVPAGLAWWRTVPGGAAWLEGLPGLVAACVRDWGLSLGAPFAPGSVAWVAPAALTDGTRAVLKVNFPEPESEHEADALALWKGSGAVRLLAHDRERRALLVERCVPGFPLWRLDEEPAYGVLCDVLRGIWRSAPPDAPFRVLADEAWRWARDLPRRWERHGRPFARALLDEAVGLCAELADSQPELVVCHQDLHGGNVLRDGDRWLVIDPKPLVGERAFDVASALRDRRGTLLREPGPGRAVTRRLDRVTGELGLDRARARGWGVVHALAWGLTDEEIHPDVVACAELLASV